MSPPAPRGPHRRQVSLGAAGLALAAAAPSQAAPAPAPAPAKAENAAIVRGYQPCRFGQVHYRSVEPKGGRRRTPVLFLHASPNCSLTYDRLLPVMGADRLAIAADTPGHGLSDRPPTQPSIADFAAAMGDLVDALGLKQIDVFGNHTGSATAVELARQRPDQVRRVVISSALMFTPQELAGYREGVAKRAAPTLDEHISSLSEGWTRHRKIWSHLGEDLAWILFWDVHRDVMHNTWGYNAVFAYDFPQAMAQIRQPLLVLNPKDDLHEVTARARPLIRNGKVLDLPDWTTGVLQIHAREVGAIVRDFLDT